MRHSNSFESEVWVVGDQSVTYELTSQFKTLAVPVYQVTPAALRAVALGEELRSHQFFNSAEPHPGVPATEKPLSSTRNLQKRNFP